MERWIGLVRVSFMGTRVAGAENVHADRDQVEALERHATMHGASLHVLPPELNVSGGLPLEKRPGLLAAIEAIERGEYDALVVAYLTRLGRSIREQLKAWDRVEAAGGRIIVVRENIDSSTAAGRMHRDILLAIAEHEREQHAERFADLREWATAAGIWQRRQTPLGYTRSPTTRKLIPDQGAEKVVRAFTDRIGGKPTLEIARDLSMTTSGVRALLRNRVYLGELSVGQHINTAAHPAIIDSETWHQAQTARVTRPLRVREHPALLAGLVRCCGCGHAMSHGRNVYSCHRHHSAGPCPAPAAITAHLLDSHVEAIALSRLREFVTRTASDDSALKAARHALDHAERELAAFLRGVVAAGLAADQFADAARERREAVDAARTVLHARLAAAPAQAITGDPVKAWEVMDGSQRHRLLSGLFEVVLVARAGGRGRVVPIESRARVIHFGAGIIDLKRYRGAARPITPIALADLDGEVIAAVDLAEDPL